jgi:hypothetical protein
MWEEDDKKHYIECLHNSLGQICNDEFAEDIRRYAADPKNRTFLEIGTWNGLGSTKAFSEGFAKRLTYEEGFAKRLTYEEGFAKRPNGEEDYVFYSLECNKDKWANAVCLYADNPRIHILNEVIWNQEPADFYDVFPQCASNPRLKGWHEVDMLNMQKCSVFLGRLDIPAVFDVILLDGGEFTTYYDFQFLKNRCKILMLDDVKFDKCAKIVQELREDPSWRILKHSDARNGYLIAERI